MKIMLQPMKVTLTKRQKYELKNQHYKTCSSRERDRIKTLLLVSESFCLASMISQAMHIRETTVLRNLHYYE